MIIYLVAITVFLAFALSRKWIGLPQWWETRDAAAAALQCSAAAPIGVVSANQKFNVSCTANHGFFNLKLKDMPLAIATPDIPSTASSRDIETELNALLHQIKDYDATQSDSAFTDFRYRDGTSNVTASSRFRVQETFERACTPDGNTWHILHEGIANIPTYADGRLQYVLLMEADAEMGNTEGCAAIALTNAD
jgi:hypothetical protein